MGNELVPIGQPNNLNLSVGYIAGITVALYHQGNIHPNVRDILTEMVIRVKASSNIDIPVEKYPIILKSLQDPLRKLRVYLAKRDPVYTIITYAEMWHQLGYPDPTSKFEAESYIAVGSRKIYGAKFIDAQDDMFLLAYKDMGNRNRERLEESSTRIDVIQREMNLISDKVIIRQIENKEKGKKSLERNIKRLK